MKLFLPPYLTCCCWYFTKLLTFPEYSDLLFHDQPDIILTMFRRKKKKQTNRCTVGHLSRFLLESLEDTALKLESL